MTEKEIKALQLKVSELEASNKKLKEAKEVKVDTTETLNKKNDLAKQELERLTIEKEYQANLKAIAEAQNVKPNVNPTKEDLNGESELYDVEGILAKASKESEGWE